MSRVCVLLAALLVLPAFVPLVTSDQASQIHYSDREHAVDHVDDGHQLAASAVTESETVPNASSKPSSAGIDRVAEAIRGNSQHQGPAVDDASAAGLEAPGAELPEQLGAALPHDVPGSDGHGAHHEHHVHSHSHYEQQNEVAAAAAAAAVLAANEARRQAAALRQRRYKEAEAELRVAEDLVGWATDEDKLDVPRGIAMLQAMFARLDAHIDAALGEGVSKRRLYTAPPAKAGGSNETDSVRAANSTMDGAEASTAVLPAVLPADADAAANSTQGGAAGGDASAAGGTAVSLDPLEHPELAPMSDAAFTLASLLSYGLASAHGLPKNDSAAMYMLHRAALAGSIEARLALTDRYIAGRGLPAMVEEALGHAKVAGPELLAQLDHAGLVHSEGGGHLRRKWMDPGYLPAANVWEDRNTLAMEQDAAARGDLEAHRQLGFRMLMGQGVARDLAGAHRAFQAAARGGDPYAIFNLGFMHIRGMHVAQNYTQARLHFLDAASRGMPAALNGLGVLYFHGQGVAVNLSEAFRYFEAAAGEDHDAAYNLGTMYQGAYSVERNMSRAIELFENATALGSWRAPHQLFMVYADGLFGAPRNHTLALKYFRHFLAMTGGWKESGKEAADRAAEGDAWGAAVRYALLAEQGMSLAQLNLAWLLHRGEAYGGSDRTRLALPLWLRAAAANQTEGMLMAAHVLREGDKWGLDGGASLSGAVELYQQAAAAGSIEGLYTMGRLREQGLGVERNISEAVRLYSQAVRTAPFECYATAPFLALWWLRLRLVLGPPLRALGSLVAAVLPPASRGIALPRLAATSGGGASVGHQPRQSALPSAHWDTLLIAVMLGMLTWVLWRKRQLTQQRTTPVRAHAVARPFLPAAVPAEQPEVALHAARAASRLAYTGAEMRHRVPAVSPAAEQEAGHEGAPTSRL